MENKFLIVWQQLSMLIWQDVWFFKILLAHSQHSLKIPFSPDLPFPKLKQLWFKTHGFGVHFSAPRQPLDSSRQPRESNHRNPPALGTAPGRTWRPSEGRWNSCISLCLRLSMWCASCFGTVLVHLLLGWFHLLAGGELYYQALCCYYALDSTWPTNDQTKGLIGQTSLGSLCSTVPTPGVAIPSSKVATNHPEYTNSYISLSFHLASILTEPREKKT